MLASSKLCHRMLCRVTCICNGEVWSVEYECVQLRAMCLELGLVRAMLLLWPQVAGVRNQIRLDQR